MPKCPNVKALTNLQHGYRLRVGNYRVLFNWNSTIKIVDIQEVRKRDARKRVPHAVVSATVDGATAVRAWREHLGLTQAEVAQR